MNAFISRFSLLLLTAVSSHAVNIAPLGSGLMGSNDATLNDAGSSHFANGTLANIRDSNLTTRVDNFQVNQPANVNGFVGVSWTTARPEAVKTLTLMMAHFREGGWFGNRECPRSGFPLTAEMLVPPVVQVSTNLTTWTTVPSTSNYVSAFTGQHITDNDAPATRAFTITLAQKQSGLRGIRIIGPTGGFGDGNGFLGVFELIVDADTLTDTDTDGMADAWETANGLNVGTNDAAADADADGLTNLKEFLWNTNPQTDDTDGDGLDDGPEDATHGSFPNAADTDADGLNDGAEITTHLTNPALADTDADGLSDAAEINTHLTLPLDRDSDDDGFSDGREITLGTLPLSAASRSTNIARAGTGLIGRNNSNSAGDLAVTGVARFNANTTSSVIDGDLYTRSDTNGMTGGASHIGVLWPSAWPQPVARMEITFATFSDAGWLGHASNIPPAGTPLVTATHLTPVPVLQTTTDGTTWTTVPIADYTTDYTTRLNGHLPGGTPRPDATRRSAVFTLNTPMAGLRGIRVAGTHRSYLAVWEVAVGDNSTPADTDGDGLADVDEIAAGISHLHTDSDDDTALDGHEVTVLLTNPQIADHDGDLWPDGLEVKLGSLPTIALSTPPNLSLIGGGIIGVNNAIDSDAGTPSVDAGTTGNITDGDILTRVGSWNGSGAGNPVSFVGARWPVNVTVGSLRAQFATFFDGGWFGVPNSVPSIGGILGSARLIAPTVQTTSDGGVTWTTVPSTSNYVAALANHAIAGPDFRATRTPVVTFSLATPAVGINGIRLIGNEGGGSSPFVGIFDLTVLGTGAGSQPPDPTPFGLLRSDILTGASFIYTAGNEVGAIIDGNPATIARSAEMRRSDPSPTGTVGIGWSAPLKRSLRSITVTMATSMDGGWFGTREAPLPGTALTAAHLGTGSFRVDVGYGTNLQGEELPDVTNDYLQQFTGHVIPSTPGAVTLRSFTITLHKRPQNVTSIRLKAPMGGSQGASGFIQIAEISVDSEPFVDTDNDQMDDAWETSRGLIVGTNDGVLDPDGDGLDTVKEYLWRSNPHLADTDGDGLNDRAEELNATFPTSADSDSDGLNDEVEKNTHFTFGNRADTDRDGLSDGAEVNTHGTNPVAVDTDQDGTGDGSEIAMGFNPLSSASRPTQFARAARPILGMTFSTINGFETANGVPRRNTGTDASLSDASLTTLAHTSDTGAGSFFSSYVGLVWPAALPPGVAITRLEVTFATFGCGGWFGPRTTAPAPGGALAAEHLTLPTLQRGDGTSWSQWSQPIPMTTNYLERMTGHVIGSTGSHATRRTVIFTPTTPITNVQALRLLGNHGRFLAITNIAVTTNQNVGDTDADGLPDAQETTLGTSPIYSDTDEDGLTDYDEINVHLTNPLLADTDGDTVQDGEEVLLATNPLSSASVPAFGMQPMPEPNMSLPGTGILGLKADLPTGLETAIVTGASFINDGDYDSTADTRHATNSSPYSYAGVNWTTPRTVSSLTLRFATTSSGGWFGPAYASPPPGNLLALAHLAEPVVQVRRGIGPWTTVPHSSDYLTIMPGHRIGDGSALGLITTVSPPARFQLTTPAENIDGIRILGPEGGSILGYLGIADFATFSGIPPITAPVNPDTDTDGLPDAWEIEKFGNLTAWNAAGDSDNDGITNLLEYAFDLNPAASDAPPAPAFEDGYLTMTLTKRPRVTYLVKSGDTLPVISSTETTILIDTPTQLKVRDNFQISGPAPRRFMTTTVTAAP